MPRKATGRPTERPPGRKSAATGREIACSALGGFGKKRIPLGFSFVRGARRSTARLPRRTLRHFYYSIIWGLFTSPARLTDIITKPTTKDEIKVERPRLHKVILVNDDFTPREFVVTVLKAEFRMSEDQAMRVMMTAHRRGACVVAVYTKDVAEAKATNATDAGRRKGYPLLFTTEPEE
jgi:ATP-dependent Clp protease adaptor protein ClpS